MPDRERGSYTMEALALVAALCLVAIFVFSHFQRQADARDGQARRFAQTLKPAVEAFFQAQPQGELTPQALADQGVSVPSPLQVEVPLDHRRADDWQVRVWHPQGRKLYLASAQGVSETFR